MPEIVQLSLKKPDQEIRSAGLICVSKWKWYHKGQLEGSLKKKKHKATGVFLIEVMWKSSASGFIPWIPSQDGCLKKMSGDLNSGQVLSEDCSCFHRDVFLFALGAENADLLP